MSALCIRALHKTYPNGFEALRGIDLQVEAGDFFALLGPNGAGKSTLIGIITSLIRKTRGRVSVLGRDLDRDPEGVKRCLGLVPQEFNFNLFLPALEVVLNQAGYYGIPLREARPRAESYLRVLGLWDRRGTEMRHLSGGLKRRLMIARALIHRPRLLILDEPTAGVDIETRRTLWEFLTELNAQGITIILTTHYLEEAERLCRTLAMINEGRMTERVEMETLLDRLQVETFLLSLRDPWDEVPSLAGFACQRRDARTLEVAVRKHQTLNELFAQLSRLGISVLSLRTKQNRLETLFFSLLGKPEKG